MKFLITLFIALSLCFDLQAQVQINNKQLKGIANPSDTTDAVNVRTVQSGNLLYATATGTNAMNLTITPAITNYSAGMIVNFKCPASNTNTVTLNINGLGAKPLFKNVMDTLEAGNIRTGQMVSVIYDGANFQLLSTPNTAGLGKTFVTLSGDITDAEAAEKILNEAGINTQYINIQNCPLITTLDLSMVKNLDYITIANNINLQSVNLSNLKDVAQGLTSSFSIYIQTNPKLSSLNLNSLQTTYAGISITSNNLTSINLPSLKYCSSFTANGKSITSINFGQATSIGAISLVQTSIQNINLNLLENISGGLIISNNSLLASINSSLIKNITGSLTISSNPLLTNISLSSLDSIGALSILSNNLLTGLNLNSLKIVKGGITFSYNPLFTNLNLSTINSTVTGIDISNNNSLTSIDCSNIKRTGSLLLSQDTSLLSIYFNSLKSMQSSFDFNQYKKLTILNLSSLDSIIGNFYLQNSLLTSLNLGSLKYISSTLSIDQNQLLTSLNLSSLKYTSYSFTISQNPLLTVMNLSSLISASDLTISNNFSLTSIDCSNLVSCRKLDIISDTLLTSINFDKLKNISGSSSSTITIKYSKLSAISFPLLDSVYSSIEISYNSYLTSVSLNSLMVTGSSSGTLFRVNYNPLLASISHTNLKSFYKIDFRYNHLSTSTINDLLAFYVNITPSIVSATIQLNNQAPTAPPSGAGITNKATLVSRGNSVTTDY